MIALQIAQFIEMIASQIAKYSMRHPYMDHAKLFPMSLRSNQKILVKVDYFINWCEVYQGPIDAP